MDVFYAINKRIRYFETKKLRNCHGNHFRTRAICTYERDPFTRHVNYSPGASNCISSKQFFFLYIPLPVCATMMSNKRRTCGSRDMSMTIRHCEIVLYAKVLMSSITANKFVIMIRKNIVININNYL